MPRSAGRGPLAVVALLAALLQCTWCSPYDAHVPPLYSPNLRTWWEGWEVRLVPYDEPVALRLDDLGAEASEDARAGWGVPPDVVRAVREASSVADGSWSGSADVEAAEASRGESRRLMRAGREALGGSPTASALPTSYSVVLGSEPRGELGWNITLVRRVEGISVGSVVIESVDEQLGVRGRGGSKVTEDPSPSAPPAVYVTSSPFPSWKLAVVDDSCEGMASDTVSGLWFRCLSAPRAWPEDDGSSGSGPEGAAALLPLQVVGGHWFVHSIATDVSYLRWGPGGLPIRGRAKAFFSKDWGSAYPEFGARVLAHVEAGEPSGGETEGGEPRRSKRETERPKAGEASSSSASLASSLPSLSSSSSFSAPVTVALSGGQLAAPFLPSGVSPDAWFVGVFTPARNWTFRPQTPSKVDVARDACDGTFDLNVTDVTSGRWVRVQASADPESFVPLAGPSLKGIVPRTKSQTQHATITVSLYEPLDTLWPVMRRWKLLERHVIQDAQLEFWRDWMCQEGDARGALRDETGGEKKNGKEAEGDLQRSF